MYTNKVKKIIFFRIPLSICNFRCHYCYLAQRDEHYQGVQPVMKYSPEQVALACSPKRLGGLAYFNFCADGETMLLKDLDLYVKELVKQGHFVEIITNMTITNMVDKFMEWPREMLEHVEFKCSFHYLELKKKKLLDVFAKNVNQLWGKGASINIEVTPSDELIPYIGELKNFSYSNFGALPHITIARNDSTKNIDYLTNLSDKEYSKTWSQFDSSFWKFKRSIFGKKQEKFCYAGAWSAYIDLSTGMANQCYCGKSLGNVFENPERPFPEKPIGCCSIPHCYNGHAFLTWGLIPDLDTPTYAEVRNRTTQNGEWLNATLKDFFSSKLCQSNKLYSEQEKKKWILAQKSNFISKSIIYKIKHVGKVILRKK